MAQKSRINKMFRNAFLTFSFTLFFSLTYSQINMTQLGYLDLATMHNTELNDIWGYTDEAGNEYAIVGLNNGTSIVDVTDPATPIEIVYIPGMNSIWRDIKTSGDYAYVTTEAEEGLLIIDMSPLPASTTLPTTYYTGPAGNEWESAHNLYMADGYLYIVGANRGNGGVIILDVMTDPMNPIEVGTFDPYYAHDAFVLNDTGYFSHVNDGFYTIVDLTDKTNVTLLEVIGSLTTPNNFTHNAWSTDDGNYLFTTDEVVDGYIASYDVTDPTNPILLDQIQSSPGNDIIPHNAHVKGNLLITSYYADGVVVHDVSDPTNLVEVANFDTSPSYNGGTFNGCWGVYPFFASDNLVASDIELGLYVLSIVPTSSSYLQGTVTDAGTGLPLNGALVEILTTTVTDNAGVLGDYSVGTILEGALEVRYSMPGYYDDTLTIDFVNGTIVTENMALVQVPLFNATITVTDNVTGNPIENANVLIEHTTQTFEGMTDVNGEVTFGLFYEDNYDIIAGKWGYYSDCIDNQSLTIASNSVTIPISEGIYDDMTFDFGWTNSGTASAGFWEREVPVGAQSGGNVANPFDDESVDCGSLAYLTGNGAGTVGGDDVDGGYVELFSPVFDLTGYANPEINFSYWFYNGFGGSAANDSLTIFISNGTDNVQLASWSKNDVIMSQWNDVSLEISNYITLSSTMQMTFIATDYSPGHVTKAGVDYFRVEELSGTNISEVDNNVISIYPNPATTELTITGLSAGSIEIFDLSGRLVQANSMSSTLDVSSLESGLYLIVLKDENGLIVKTQKQQIR